MRNKYFIVKHYILPASDARTESKNYGKEGKKLVDERVSFTPRLSDRDLAEATYIINLDDKTVVKSRFRHHEENEVKDTDAIRHYLKEYKEEITRENKNYDFNIKEENEENVSN